MNSQIFHTRPFAKSKNAIPLQKTMGASPAFQWLSAIILIAAVILFPERPAWGSDFDIHDEPKLVAAAVAYNE